MSASLESHRDRFAPQDWWRLMKMFALYAQELRASLSGGRVPFNPTAEEIFSITLTRVKEECAGYVFKDGDILFFFFLCRCCRKTVRTLYLQESADAARLQQDDDDTPAVLTERAALTFLQRRQSLDAFLAFIKEQKLKGKLRAYGTSFPRYAEQSWNVERIAKDLRVTPPTVARYRSRLREFLEAFELRRARHSPA